MYTSKYWLNFDEMWTNWPTKEMSGLFKWYYLVQFAFWVQQIVVVNIEERRKDYHQMFTHHIVTCSLVLGSYGSYQMKVGNVILCIMDVVDITLPVGNPLDLTFIGRWRLTCCASAGQNAQVPSLSPLL